MQSKKFAAYDKNPFNYSMETGKPTRDIPFQYYPPKKRKEIRDYLSKSNIRFQGTCTHFSQSSI